MEKRLKSVNKDILFLSFRSFSFGKIDKPVNPIDTGIVHDICGVPVHIYYYDSKNTLSWTPGYKHTIYSKSYEGKHHPICKIDTPEYKDYIINEGGVKWKGNIVVFSTENLENNDPNVYNDDMLAALVLACFYSLHQRLHYYIHRIEDLGLTIDPGHNLAPMYTKDKINSIMGLFKNISMKECVQDVMDTFKPINLNQLMILFEEIKYFSSEIDNKNPTASERKNFIIDMYNTLIKHEPFNKPRIKSKETEPIIKPRKLF
jgi:hypothetical protein